MPSFYNGKRFFLTYPQCPKLANELVAFLQIQANVKSYVVARERHADGEFHLHACVEFATVQRRTVTWLDFDGHHPNKQDPRNWAACQTYCKKDGDYIEGPQSEEPQDIVSVCQEMESEISWFEYCVQKKIPYPYATWFWNRLHCDSTSITERPTAGTMCASLRSMCYDGTDRKCLILKGPTGCGKTTWALMNMPLPALFVTHIDSLKKFRIGKNLLGIYYSRISQEHHLRWRRLQSLPKNSTNSFVWFWQCSWYSCAVWYCSHSCWNCQSIYLQRVAVVQWPSSDEKSEKDERYSLIKKCGLETLSFCPPPPPSATPIILRG